MGRLTFQSSQGHSHVPGAGPGLVQFTTVTNHQGPAPGRSLLQDHHRHASYKMAPPVKEDICTAPVTEQTGGSYSGTIALQGFPDGSGVKNPPASAGDAPDLGPIPGSGRSPRERNGNPLQYACLGNLMDRGAWRDTVQGVTQSQTGLSN